VFLIGAEAFGAVRSIQLQANRKDLVGVSKKTTCQDAKNMLMFFTVAAMVAESTYGGMLLMT